MAKANISTQWLNTSQRRRKRHAEHRSTVLEIQENQLNNTMTVFLSEGSRRSLSLSLSLREMHRFYEEVGGERMRAAPWAIAFSQGIYEFTTKTSRPSARDPWGQLPRSQRTSKNNASANSPVNISTTPPSSC